MTIPSVGSPLVTKSLPEPCPFCHSAAIDYVADGYPFVYPIQGLLFGGLHPKEQIPEPGLLHQAILPLVKSAKLQIAAEPHLLAVASFDHSPAELLHFAKA